MSFGERIKQLRKDKEWSQEYVATKLNISVGALSRYETGMFEPKSLSLVNDIANLFNVTTDYLLGKSYYRNYDQFVELDNFYAEYSLKKQTPEDAKLIANTLNYINAHKNQDIDTIIENAIQPLSPDKKAVMKKILYHLHYRYHDMESTHQAINYSIKQNNIFSTSEFIKIPVVGKIAAGQPILAEEYLEGYLPVDPNIYGITTPEEYFYLKVAGQSMNLKVKNGDYALIHKQDYAEDGDIVVAIVNGDEEATLKKFKKLNQQFVLLEPMSSDPTIEAITVDLKDTNFKIIGKAIGQFGKI